MGFGGGVFVWRFVGAFGVDDELEELDDFLVFAFVVEDHFEELREFDFAGLVFVYGVNELLDFLAGVHEPDTDQEFLKLIDANGSGLFGIHGIEAFLHLFSFSIIKVNEVAFTFFGEPFAFL